MLGQMYSHVYKQKRIETQFREQELLQQKRNQNKKMSQADNELKKPNLLCWSQTEFVQQNRRGLQ